MKYMYFDVDISIDDTETIKKKQDSFNERYRLYRKKLENLESCFPKRFIKKYIEEFFFHDYVIQDISYEFNDISIIHLTISNGKDTYIVTYQKVSAFTICLADALYGTEIVYNEILPLGDGVYSHEFDLSRINNKITIVFKSLRFKRQKSND